MKSHSVFIAAGLLLLFIACNSTHTDSAQTTESKPDMTLAETCYQYAANKDTISLKVSQSGDCISGTLLYSLYEKDRNQGTIDGNVKGDLLIADYTFQSEGMTSVRQIVFKKTGTGLAEGFGEVTVKNDTVSFRNVAALQFNEAFRLTETECP